MNTLIKPANFLLIALNTIVFFLLGALIASGSGAVQGAGLAGGPVIFWGGMIPAFFALLLAVWMVYYVPTKKIVIVNIVLFFMLLILLGVVFVS